jgi:hypothetical protein
MVVSKINNCNLTLTGISASLKYQVALKVAGNWLVSRREEQYTELLHALHELHWLWVPDRIVQFHLCVSRFTAVFMVKQNNVISRWENIPDPRHRIFLTPAFWWCFNLLMACSVRRFILGDWAFPQVSALAQSCLPYSSLNPPLPKGASGAPSIFDSIILLAKIRRKC